MKPSRYVLTVGCLTVLLFTLFVPAAADGADPDVIVFYQEGCNDCRHMDQVLDDLVAVYPELVVVHIEETEFGAVDLMWALSAKYGIFPSKFPVIFVGSSAFTGVGRDKEMMLESAVRSCVFHGCDSPLSRLEGKPIPWLTIGMILLIALFIGVVLFA